uniref:Uncharacterized protein n=1 Tax=Arundo donax TaxID=35708 RepID=A0A0A8ZSP4_ARUDO
MFTNSYMHKWSAFGTTELTLILTVMHFELSDNRYLWFAY